MADKLIVAMKELLYEDAISDMVKESVTDPNDRFKFSDIEGFLSTINTSVGEPLLSSNQINDIMKTMELDEETTLSIEEYIIYLKKAFEKTLEVLQSLYP